MQWKVFPTMILIFTGLNGCASIGPGTVARDASITFRRSPIRGNRDAIQPGQAPLRGCAGFS